MKFNSKTRRKSIKVWVSDEERILLEAKVEHYGYKRMAEYIRDAVIYEKVTYIDLKNKNEIYEAYSNNTKELKKIAKEFRHISKYATQLSSDDLKNMSSTMYTILKKQKEMIKLIENKLDLESWKKINDSKYEEEVI